MNLAILLITLAGILFILTLAALAMYHNKDESAAPHLPEKKDTKYLRTKPKKVKVKK